MSNYVRSLTTINPSVLFAQMLSSADAAARTCLGRRLTAEEPEPMAKIRIVSVPAGEAPEWVRKEWVGLEIPVFELNVRGTEGVLGGKAAPENEGGYGVDVTDALRTLEAKSSAAAEWWSNLISSLDPVPQQLVFGRNFCELIS
ncbi:MAG: hypothetical protein ISP90_15945 [Nevskia sp.]|nr:hypothetical protein [Nevskia sp.]